MPMVIKLDRVTYHEELLLVKSHSPLITVLTRSRNKLKPLYLHYYSAYGHQTWQDGDSP